MITLNSDIPNIKDLEYLYNDVGWINYTNDLNKLENAFKNSLRVISAWDNQKLVGLVRIIGDGLTIIYIQDILVLVEYQRMGIGKKLINYVLEEYGNVRQKVLITDNEPNTVEFYKSVGFNLLEKYNGVSFVNYTF